MGDDFNNKCLAECADYDVDKDCVRGVCEASYSAMSGGYNGIMSLGKHSGSSQWNIMIVIIQFCILAVCCLSLGLSISFCFKNPNKLMGPGKSQSFGRDQ